MSLLVVLAMMAQSYRGQSQGSDLVIRATHTSVTMTAGTVSCKALDNLDMVTFGCTINYVVVYPAIVDLRPGSQYESWEYFSPGAYPGYAPSGPAEREDGVSILLTRSGHHIHWKATARTADGRSIKEEGDF